MQIGLDIGSTTIKIAVLDDAGNLLFHKYERHYSQIAEKILALHKELMTNSLHCIAHVWPSAAAAVSV